MQKAAKSVEMALKLRKLQPKTTALFLCDMQEKFRNTVSYFAEIINVSNRMLQAAQVLQMPVIATEQYPKGLGHTVPELDLKSANVPLFTKTCFSMVVDSVEKHLKEKHGDVNSIILCGIEAHACIYQTTLDLLGNGYDVHLVVDAISSRNPVDRMFAFRQMEKAGAVLTTSECILLTLLKDAGNPKFKQIQKIIMDKSPDSGLLSFKL